MTRRSNRPSLADFIKARCTDAVRAAMASGGEIEGAERLAVLWGLWRRQHLPRQVGNGEIAPPLPEPSSQASGKGVPAPRPAGWDSVRGIYLTHYDEATTGDRAKGPQELHELYKQLEALFQLHLLGLLGIDGPAIDSIVRNNRSLRDLLVGIQGGA